MPKALQATNMTNDKLESEIDLFQEQLYSLSTRELYGLSSSILV